MKNPDIIQVAVMIVALFLGYNALQTVPYFIWLLFSWFSDGLTLAGSFQNAMVNFMFIAFYIAGAWFLIKNSKIISEKITGSAAPTPNVSITAGKNDILFVTLVAMGGYMLVTRLPKLLVNFYLYVRGNNKPFSYDGPNYTLPGETIVEHVLIVLMAITLLVYAKAIAQYLAGKKEDQDLIDKIGTAAEEK